MGCGSSRGHVSQEEETDAREHASNQAEEAEAKCNAALAAHLSAILGIEAVSDTVVRYVAQLRSEGCDTSNDFKDLTADELAGDPFNFKRLHVQKVAVSWQKEELTQAEGVAGSPDAVTTTRPSTQVDETSAKAKQADNECNTTLSKHLSLIFGIPPASADINNYLSGLRSEGCDTPQDFDGLPIDELAWEPFNFKRLHLQKVRNIAAMHRLVHVRLIEESLFVTFFCSLVFPFRCFVGGVDMRTGATIMLRSEVGSICHRRDIVFRR